MPRPQRVCECGRQISSNGKSGLCQACSSQRVSERRAYQPTPEDIARETALIRAEWNEEERSRRRAKRGYEKRVFRFRE